MNVAVLGSTGMLGGRIISVLRNAGLVVVSTSKKGGFGIDDVAFDVRRARIEDALSDLRCHPDFIINAIGVIKPHIVDSRSESVGNAIEVNSVFPYQLAEVAERSDVRVIQIATDCVYSGLHGSYTEISSHDCSDVYGKSKSLGEVISRNVMHVRVSVIGPEKNRSTSLWEWVRNQPIGNRVNGYVNHLWNGVTTDAFGEICRTIIQSDKFVAGTTHLVPADKASKYELVKLIASHCNRDDLQVQPISLENSVNRTLATNNAARNEELWQCSTFERTPTISEMIAKVSI